MKEKSNIDKRKLQRVGRSFTVSLPIEFVRNHGLNNISNATVVIIRNTDGSLTILPDTGINSQVLGNEITIHAYREVAREAVEKVLSGAEKVNIISDKIINPEIREEIQVFVSGLPQTEIIENSPQRIVIYSLEFKNIPTRKMLHRQLSIISEIFADIEQKNYKNLEWNIKELKKFYLILTIHLRRFHNTGISLDEDELTQKMASDFRVFSYQVKMIGYVLKDLVLDDSISSYFTKIKEYFEKIFDAFLKKDEKLAHKLWFENKILTEEGKELLSKIPDETKHNLKAVLMIVKLCRGMTALIYS